MSNRIFKWKEAGKTAERLNRILRTDGFRLPNKFAPSSKDRSESVDKVFNNSRSRLHSSLQITALNRTQQNQSMQLDKVSKVESKERKHQHMQKKNSTFLSVLPHSITRNPTVINPTKGSSSQLIADLKKEYMAFKKNILKELDRQREMIQKMVKEIVLTIEVEIDTIKQAYSSIKQPTPIIQLKPKDSIKSIEQWKTTLKKVSIVDKPPTDTPQIIQKRLQSPTKKQKTIEPPKLLMNVDMFLGSFNILQKKIKEMDRIFDGSRDNTQLPI